MRRTRQSIALLTSLTWMGCSSLGGGGGGGDNLPNRGIVPYDRVLSGDEEAPVFSLESADPGALIYVEPHAVITEAEAVLLFAEARDPTTGLGAIMRCQLDTALSCSAPSTVLDPSGEGHEWLESRAGAPSVLRHDDTWLMAFAYGSGHRYRARVERRWHPVSYTHLTLPTICSV